MADFKCKARPAGKAERAKCFFTNTTVTARSRYARYTFPDA